MALSPGARIGPYEVSARIGTGGMGEVYRATDTNLARPVALKVLPDAVAQDAERLARFDREAKTLAALNHPNIAQIHGLERSGGTTALVMELVEGPTLADRIAAGPLPIEEVLHIAKQMAEALEAAHEQGIIHRDLKPANVKVRPDGTVKVLDFGLAKATGESSASDAGVTHSPTLSLAATQQGLILGTAGYMSPEQAKGRSVDKRTDVWAFGCVLYEMLTGRRAFEGDDLSETLASVIKGATDLALLPPDLHPTVRKVLRRCLEKDPARRLRDIGDVRFDLEQLLADPDGLRAPSTVDGPGRMRSRSLAAWIAASVVATALLTVTLVRLLAPDQPVEVSRFSHVLSEGQSFGYLGYGAVALSPDGRQLVYATPLGLFLRPLESLEARLIEGSEGPANNPFFSPDGEWVGYVDSRRRRLRKVPIRGGVAVPLSDASDEALNIGGASWSADGTVLFSRREGIFGVAADGGTPELLVETRDGEQIASPQGLPDGDSILFSTTTASGAARWDQADIVVQSLSSGARTLLVRGGSDARYVPTGHLVYALGDALMAVPVDLDRLEVAGEAARVVNGVTRARGGDALQPTGTAQYAIAANGTLAYMAAGGRVGPDRRLGLVDADGDVELLEMRSQPYLNPRVSSTGQVVVETLSDDGTSALWIYDLDSASAIRPLAQQEGNNSRPIWTPDGERIAFTSDRGGTPSVWWQPADGSGAAAPLTVAEDGTEHWPTSWSPDGRTLAFTVAGRNNPEESAIWTLSLDRPDAPELFYDVPGSPEDGALFSPDGAWLAYWSRGGTGDNQVWVQPFPQTGANRHRLTEDGGTYPLWSTDGRHLYYRRAFSTTVGAVALNEIDVELGTSPAWGTERTLPLRDFLVFNWHRDYDVAPDGRFLMVFPADGERAETPARPGINIVLNWHQELTRLVPVD